MGVEQIGDPSTTTRALVRARLAQAVTKLAVAIANGDHVLDLSELQTVALICDEYRLPMEAARVRRWIAGASTARDSREEGGDRGSAG